MILVMGATGNAGGAAVQALVNAGVRVRALVRDPSAALPDGVVAGTLVVAGDEDSPAGIG